MQKLDTNLVAVVTTAYCDVADAASPGGRACPSWSQALGAQIPARLPTIRMLSSKLLDLFMP